MSLASDGEEVVTVEDCRARAETAKALLVEIPDADQALWVPQSQIHGDSEVYKKDHVGKLVITRWWAEKNGLAD